jgi:hypothetical protein
VKTGEEEGEPADGAGVRVRMASQSRSRVGEPCMSAGAQQSRMPGRGIVARPARGAACPCIPSLVDDQRVTRAWRIEVADGLMPQEVSAGLITGGILTSDLPDIAAWWLADGRNTPALRELGGAPKDDAWTLDALWKRVCDELRIAMPSEEEAARIDVRRILAEWQAGRQATREVLQEFDLMSLYRFDGLDETAGLLDEIEGGWGREDNEVLADAEERLGDLARSFGSRPAWPSW